MEIVEPAECCTIPRVLSELRIKYADPRDRAARRRESYRAFENLADLRAYVLLVILGSSYCLSCYPNPVR